MLETLELRVLEERAGDIFPVSEGKSLGDGVRKVVLPTSDPRFGKVSELQRFWRTQRSFFFAGWNYHRKYSRQELDSAECFQLNTSAIFEPAGEDCGTVYDDSCACPHVFVDQESVIQGRRFRTLRTCGVGARQISNLFLDLRKVPRNKDIARTIAREWIISQRLAELLVDANMTGFELHKVMHKARFIDDPVRFESLPAGRELLRRAEKQGCSRNSWCFDVWLNKGEQRDLTERVWEENAERLEERERKKRPDYPVYYQLVITSPPLHATQPTKFGIEPFDEDPNGLYRCPFGHIVGLNLLSEVTVSRADWDGSDVACTKDMVGVRAGLLRPHPILLMSPRLRRLFSEHSVRGFEIEVVHLK